MYFCNYRMRDVISKILSMQHKAFHAHKKDEACLEIKSQKLGILNVIF